MAGWLKVKKLLTHWGFSNGKVATHFTNCFGSSLFTSQAAASMDIKKTQQMALIQGVAGVKGIWGLRVCRRNSQDWKGQAQEGKDQTDRASFDRKKRERRRWDWKGSLKSLGGCVCMCVNNLEAFCTEKGDTVFYHLHEIRVLSVGCRFI